MILIIAEKPSLARNIAAALAEDESPRRHDGYLEYGNYLITWAFGHLFSLADVEEYAPNPDGSTRWSMKNIPCFPQTFIFQLRRDKNKKEVDPGVQKQFEIIRSLCLRTDVETIVNAGDSDREGEIIVRLCIQNTGVQGKDLRRLWLPDQTPQTIREAIGQMKAESEYDNLANEGFARTYIDWLYGVNLTRYATLKTGVFLRVGRVIVPIVKAIYDRDMAIRNFVPETYYALVSNAQTQGQKIELVSKQKFDKDHLQQAQECCAQYNAAEAIVTDVKTKKDTLQPGKLYSLSKLQNVLGKKYKMSMEDSLSILQKLYEAGYVTYPRTNSEYLAENEQDKIKKILQVIQKMNYPVAFRFKKTIFDDKKIEAHSALTPTYKIPSPKNLTEPEMQVYSTIFRRFVAVFCSEECLAEKSEIRIDVDNLESFTLKGTVIVQKGWTKYDDCSQKDKLLPKLEKGDRIEINFQPTEKQTSPPRHYTIETLNNYLKNPFREEKAQKNQDPENDEEEYRAIFEGLELGTEATRTGIIDNARKSNYIQLKKDVYTILPDGEYLIRSLQQMQINMDKYKTSQLGRALKQVYHNTMSVEESVALAKQEINDVFQVKSISPEQDTDIGFFGDEAGLCPLCGEKVVRTRFGYGCTGYRKNNCKFTINTVICGRIISLQHVKQLLAQGKTSRISGFISKNGKSFDAYLKLEDGKVKFQFD